MAFRSINTLQFPENLTYILNSYTNNYMYESLANLGQRFSLKGDGITSETFDVAKLFNIDLEKSEITPKNTVSKLYIENNEAYISLEKLETGEIFETQDIKYTTDTVLYTDTNIKLDFKINGIDYYAENALIYSTDSSLTVSTIGCDDDNGKVELNIDRYNLITNTMEESLKLVNTGDDERYYIYYLSKQDDKYSLQVQYIYKNSLSYTTFGEYLDNIFYNYVKEYYILYNDISIEAIYNEIVNTGYVQMFTDMPVSYNDNEYEGFYNDEYHNIVNSILNHMYNQVIYMYPFMFEYYCDYLYKSDNNQLKKYILYKLFYKAYKDSGVERIKDFVLYIPLDYSFDYYCNDADKYYIYTNETPISVYYTINDLTTEYVNKYYTSVETDSVIIAHSVSIENIVLYKFNVCYNSTDTNLINSIAVQEMYSTPYIQDDYWYINGQKTPYRAVGQDAGNPNIILVYVDNVCDIKDNFNVNEHYSILTSTDVDVLNNLSWERTTVKTQLLTSLDLSDYNDLTDISLQKYITSYTLFPNVYNENTAIKNKLANSLIINIATIDNITGVSNDVKFDIKNLIGANSFITTFWAYNEKTLAFENIVNPNTGYSLSFTDISNTNNIITNQITTAINKIQNKQTVSSLTFNGVSNLKNANLVDSTVIYPTLSNVTSADFVNTLNSKVNYSEYNNNLMFMPSFATYTNDNKVSNTFLNATLANASTKEYAFNISASNIYTLSNLYNYNNDMAYIHSYANEYIPVDNIPVFNFAEILLQNVNTVNRNNILSFTNTGDIYYSYIGTSNEDTNKSVLHIGTSNLNTTIGTSTLCNPKDIDKFKKQDTIAVDFEKIELNANVVENSSYFTYFNGHNIKQHSLVKSTSICIEYDEPTHGDIIHFPNGTNYAPYICNNVDEISYISFADIDGNTTAGPSNFVRIPFDKIVNTLGIYDAPEMINSISVNTPVIFAENYHSILVAKETVGDSNIFRCTIDYSVTQQNTYNIHIICPADEIMAFPIKMQYQIN